MTTRHSRLPLKWLLRVGVSALVLGIVLYMLPTEEVWKTLRAISFWAWSACLAIFLLGHVVASLKWRLLIRDAAPITPGLAVRAHFAGLVANLCLPGVAGGDVVRAGLAMRGAHDGAAVAVGSLADRLIDMLALLVLGFIGAQLAASADVGAIGTLMRVGAALLIILGGALVGAKFAMRLPLHGKLQMLVSKVANAIDGFASNPGRPLVAFVLALLIQSTFIGLNAYLAAKSGMEVPVAAWFFAWPVAKLVATAPVSVAGLGVREATLATIMAPMGVDPALVVAVGLVWQSILFAGGFLGGALLLLSGGLTQSNSDTSIAHSGHTSL